MGLNSVKTLESRSISSDNIINAQNKKKTKRNLKIRKAAEKLREAQMLVDSMEKSDIEQNISESICDCIAEIINILSD